MMSKEAFAVLLLAGAAALALWVELRFPKLAPTSLRRASFHVASAAFTLFVLMPFGMELVGPGGSGVHMLAAIFGVALPSLTYGLLVSVWVLNVARRALGNAIK